MAARESDQKAIKQEEPKPPRTTLELHKVLKPKLLSLALATVSKQPDQPQLEFVHYALEIVNTCIQNKELRETILFQEMPAMKQVVELQAAVHKAELVPANYCQFLVHLEK